MRQRKVNGIVYFPNDYSEHLAKGETARLCLFCDMSSFLYYRSVYTGASAVLVDEMKEMYLDVPHMTALAGELRAAGMSLRSGILTAEELAEEVERLCPLKQST